MSRMVLASVAVASALTLAGPVAALGQDGGVTGGTVRSGPPHSGPSASVPEGKIAVINVSVFPDQVFEYKRKLGELNTQFEPRTIELRGLADNITGIEAQVKQGTASPEQLSQLSERYEMLKRDYTRKQEDLKRDGERAFEAAVRPIRTKMTDALKKFCDREGIVLVLEVGSALKIGSVDITEQFVAEYNKANP
jgi:Skp family chaperone for outer membrane proteins